MELSYPKGINPKPGCKVLCKDALVPHPKYIGQYLLVIEVINKGEAYPGVLVVLPDESGWTSNIVLKEHIKNSQHYVNKGYSFWHIWPDGILKIKEYQTVPGTMRP